MSSLAAHLLADEENVSAQRRGLRAGHTMGSRSGRRAGRSAGSKPLIPPEPFKDPNTTALVRDLFGHEVLLSDFELAFSALLGGDFYRAKVHATKDGIQGGRDREGLYLRLWGKILRNDHQVGRFKRTFARPRNHSGQLGPIVAQHDLIELDDDLPSGIGTAMARNTLIWERGLGVREVRLHAEWVGRYIWAKFGWNWADMQEFQTKTQELKMFLRPRLFPGTTCFSAAETKKTCAMFDGAQEGAHGIAKIVAPRAWNVATLKIYDAEDRVQTETCDAQESDAKGVVLHACPTGKAFLLSSRTTGWDGRLILRDGDPGWERCKRVLAL